MNQEDVFKESLKEVLPEVEDQFAPPAEITEALLGEIAVLREEEKRVKSRLEWLVEHVRILLPQKERVYMQQYGQWVLKATTTKTTRVDWEAFVEDQIGPDAFKEISDTRDLVKAGKADSKFVKCSEAIRIEVNKLT